MNWHLGSSVAALERPTDLENASLAMNRDSGVIRRDVTVNGIKINGLD